MEPFRGTERFVLQQCLGSGSFGSVYEVLDQERQARVALKVPHEATAAGLFLFKREFRSLADVCHPNLISFHELISDDARWFFTMELVEGIDILRHLRAHARVDGLGDEEVPAMESGSSDGEHALDAMDAGPVENPPPATGPLDYPRVSRVFKQLGHGLMAIHRAGLLHKDIKPSNVLVTRKGRVVLLDFGLSGEIDALASGLSDASGIAGTPAYMAPEQLLDNRCSEASDWYSVGVLLYHVLTGCLPFEGNGLRVLVNKVSQAPEPPSALVDGVPRELSDLCMDLLSANPKDRPSGSEFLQRLERSEVLTQAARPGPSREYVGRTLELEALINAFQALQEGQPAWVNVHGGSGMGKTFLMRRLQREIRRQAPEALVLSGRCYEQEHVPYKALDGIVDELSHYLKHLPEARLDALLPRHADALAQLFPVLRQVPRIAELRRRRTAIADPQALRNRAFAALRELLRRLGETLPLVLAIDDLQWGDADSALLLTDLLNPPDAPVMLLVACYRTEESGTSPVLRDFLALGRAALGRSVELPLRELPLDRARKLAQNLLEAEGDATPEMVDWIARESGGNPFFIQELAQHAGFRRSPETAAGNLETHIQVRMAALPTEAQDILGLAALAGYPLDWRILREASASVSGGAESLDLLRRDRFVRLRTVDKRRTVEPYHDLIRRSVVAGLSLEQARDGHRRIARVLESAPESDVQALALHFKAAGDTEKAIDYLTTAGIQASESLAFGRAASLLRMALRLRSPDDPGTGGTWRLLGEALANAGRGKEAAEAYLEAAGRSGSREANGLLRLAAQEYLRNGHFQEGIAVLDRVLSAIGDRLASSPAESLLSAIYHKLLLALRGLRFTERETADIPPATLDRLDAYWAIITGLATGNVMRVADFQARQLLLGLRAGNRPRLVRALAYEAIFSSSMGNRKERTTQKYLGLALVHAEKVGDPASMSQALIAAGIAHTAMGRWRKAAEILDRVEIQLRDNGTGLAYELRSAQSYALLNHYVLGNLAVLAARLPALLRDAEESGDLLFLANLKTASAFIHHLAQDDPETARSEIRETMVRLPGEGFFYQRYLELAALGNIGLYCGEVRASWTMLAERWGPLRESRLMMAQAIRITCLELRARLALALAAESRVPSERKTHRARARKDTQALRRERIPYGTALALRLQVLDARIAGRHQEAESLAFLAETAFEASDMALHAQVMKRCRGLMKGETGQGLVREAEDWMRRQGIISPPRMTAMFLPGIGLE